MELLWRANATEVSPDLTGQDGYVFSWRWKLCMMFVGPVFAYNMEIQL